MAKIGVNKKEIVLGKLTVKRFLDEENKIVIQGSFATHKYFEEIKNIETYRLKISGIEVLEEIFGSDDFDIIYNFIAKNIEMKNSGVTYTEDEIEVVEKTLYDNEGYIKNSNLSVLSNLNILEEKE